MSEEEQAAATKPARPARAANDLQARIRAQQEAPGNPTGAFTPPPVPPAQSMAPTAPSVPTPAPQLEQKRSEKGPTRATHFVDDQGIEWVRTGITLPNAYLKGIIAYVNQRRLEWSVGDPRVTQQDIEIEAIGIWLNDHRSELPANVNAMCDDVRAKLRRS